MGETKEIGDAGNRYGGVVVKEEDEKFFWAVEDWDGESWEEIPQYLYDALIRFENERHNNRKDNP